MALFHDKTAFHEGPENDQGRPEYQGNEVCAGDPHQCLARCSPLWEFDFLEVELDLLWILWPVSER